MIVNKANYSGEEPALTGMNPAENKPGRSYQRRGMAHGEMLHIVLREEPMKEVGRFSMSFLEDLGIAGEGQPFAPDARPAEILLDAVVVDEAVARKGWEWSWSKSAPGRAWLPRLRFHGPTEPYFDQSWKLPPIERVDFAESDE